MTRRVLCRLDEIPDPGSRGFDFREGDALRSVFVVRTGDTVRAYENACPHTDGPLDWVPDQFLTREKDMILCATHGALFRIEDGHCLSGPCIGEDLRQLPVSIEGDAVAVEF
jgi:nitrite reductase/ring-hydroxylating ferredoxin subunit